MSSEIKVMGSLMTLSRPKTVVLVLRVVLVLVFIFVVLALTVWSHDPITGLP